MGDGVVIRVQEGCDGDPNLLWDSIWNEDLGFADWALASPSETSNVGGLSATAAIDTAVVLALFTDKRIDPTHPLWYLADGDRRGWWGDGIDVRADLNEGPLGSLLWVLERAPMTIKSVPIETWAVQFANEALQTLLNQQVCARIDVSATADAAAGQLLLTVSLYASDGTQTYNRNFDVLWNQVAT